MVNVQDLIAILLGIPEPAPNNSYCMIGGSWDIPLYQAEKIVIAFTCWRFYRFRRPEERKAAATKLVERADTLHMLDTAYTLVADRHW
jgi:hypothetical protein